MDMISELCDDNQQLTRSLRAAHEVCDRHNDVATASLIEVWIDESEKRTWFLAEIAQVLKARELPRGAARNAGRASRHGGKPAGVDEYAVSPLPISS